jgi:hypothetical protein
MSDLSELKEREKEVKKEYLTFVSSLEGLPENQEIQLVIRDLTPGPQKYDARYVKAIVSRSPEKLSGHDILWVRSQVGVLYPEHWYIKIITEIGEYPEEA